MIWYFEKSVAASIEAGNARSLLRISSVFRSALSRTGSGSAVDDPADR